MVMAEEKGAAYFGTEDYTQDGTVDLQGRPVFRSNTGRWKACSFIVGYEVFERMAYYGIASNLVVYLTTKLHEGTVTSSNNVTNWVGTVWMTPLLGAYIADAHLGRYWTFVIASAIYLVGMSLLTLAVSLPALRPPTCGDGVKLEDCDKRASPFQVGIFYCALYIIAIGTGGTKPNISTMGADQFDEFEPKEKIQKLSFFNWWMFSIFFGTLFSNTILIYIQENVGWALGYGLPTLGLAISISVFLVGTKFYRHKLPSESPFSRIAHVLVAFIRKWRVPVPDDPKQLHELNLEEYTKSEKVRIDHSPSLGFLDKAAVKSGPTSPWMLCPVTQVEETKQMIKMVPILIATFLPSMMLAQGGTLFVKQGITLDRSIGPHFDIPPACLSAFVTIFMLISLVLYDRFFVPAIRKYTKNPRGITLLQRLGIGLVLHIIILMTAFFAERRRLSVIHENNLFGKRDKVPLTIFILLPQFALAGIADTFVEVAKIEFFYDQAPQGMKSLGTSYFTTSLGIGSFLSSFLLSTVADLTKKHAKRGWILDNLNRSHLDYYYLFLASLSFLNLLFFLLVSKYYVYNVDTRETLSGKTSAQDYKDASNSLLQVVLFISNTLDKANVEEKGSAYGSGDQTQDGTVDLKGRRILRSNTGRWKACSFIVGYEVFERMAYYGIASNLVVYLTTRLHEGTVKSSNNVTNWVGTVWIMPLLGAYIADAHLGRYWTFVISSVIYLVGMSLLTLAVSLTALRPPSCGNGVKLEDCDKRASSFQIGIFYCALYIIALGTGGTKPNISTMGADQFDDFEPKERIQKLSFFNWWMFSVFFGTLFSNTFLVYIQDTVGWTLGYGLPTLGLAISVTLFLFGTKFFRHKLPSESPLSTIAHVIVAAIRKWRVTVPDNIKDLHELNLEKYTKAGHFRIDHSSSLRFLDKAAVKTGPTSPWMLRPVTQVEQTKQMVKMIPILVATFIPSTMLAQTGTLFVKQGTTLDRNMGHGFEIPPACLNAFVTIFMLLSLVLYDRYFVPIVRRYTKNPRGITLLQRLGIGLVLHIIVMITACLAERKRLSVIHENNLFGKKDKIPLTIFILLPQFALMGVADCFVETAKIKFFYDQAPEGMKSLGASYFTTSIGIGSFLSSFILSTVSKFTMKHTHKGWILDDLNTSHFDYYYLFLAVLLCLNLLFFLVVAKYYVYNADLRASDGHFAVEASAEKSTSCVDSTVDSKTLIK